MTDLAVGLLRDGYGALELDRRRRRGGPSYVTRLLGARAVVVTGAAGARLFYDEEVVERSGAVPPPLAWLLFGRGAVHGLDDAAHRVRKDLFLGLLGPDRVAPCADSAERHLSGLLAGAAGHELPVFSTLVTAYGRAVTGWAGVELGPRRTDALSRRLARIVDGFGFAGSAYLRGWQARLQTDAWARRYVEDVRAGRYQPPHGSVVRALADADLDARTAGVELLNVLRPTVAVSWLGTFAVAALAAVPQWRERLAADGAEAERVSFAQEVRRTSPFVPALAGRVRRDTTHGDLVLRAGDRIVLDVRGLNHDPTLHADPTTFRPDRFLDHQPGPYEMVPQGGGPPGGHRCPGESLAVQLLSRTVRRFAAAGVSVAGPPAADLTRMPTLPPGGLRIRLCD